MLQSLRLLALLALSLTGCIQATSPNTSVTTAHGVAFTYLLPIQGISDSNITLQHYVNQTTLLFYFNPNCPHCQAAISDVQLIVNARSAKGLQSLALATSDVSKQSILDFISIYHTTMPVAQDTAGDFENSYGSGYVPLYMVIHRDGSYTRYPNNDSATLTAVEAELDSALAQ